MTHPGTSLGGDPPARDERAEALVPFCAFQTASLAKDWGGILGCELTPSTPVVEAEATFPSLLSWPGVSTAIEIERPLRADFYVVASAGAVDGFFEGPGPSRRGPLAEEALQEVFGFLLAATERAFRKEVSNRFNAGRATTRAAAGPADVAGDQILSLCAEVQVDFAARDGRFLRLHEAFPPDLVAAMVEARRADRGLLHRGPSTIHTAVGARAKVLVVDDHILIRRVLKYHLQQAGYDVTEATGGADAVAKVDAAVPDLVLLDVMMPGMDGFEVCRRIHAIPGCARVPVIFCTARDAREDVMEAVRSGAQDYIVKPFRKEALLAKVAKFARPAPPA